MFQVNRSCVCVSGWICIMCIWWRFFSSPDKNMTIIITHNTFRQFQKYFKNLKNFPSCIRTMSFGMALIIPNLSMYKPIHRRAGVFGSEYIKASERSQCIRSIAQWNLFLLHDICVMRALKHMWIWCWMVRFAIAENSWQ